ncbi:MAG: deoxyhypusine synthase [Candidatus Bathyarchaeota archaeon]|nr:deoxyhypusine synthase [Candidatus Bathyarchaeota archaeon]
MKDIKQIKLEDGITVARLIEEMDACGVLGAGRLGKASRLLKEMFKDRRYTVFLTLAGALVAGGLRSLISDLIDKGRVDVLITTGANMVHDMLEALGYHHKIGEFKAHDEELRARNIGRIGDIYIEHETFGKLEKWLSDLLDRLPDRERRLIAPSDLLREIGGRLDDENSILVKAAQKNVPVICPGLPDSIVGFQLWVYGQGRDLILNPLGDTSALVAKVYEAKKSGVIILGGGWPKHFALFANTFRGGVDAAVQITMDRPEPGGLSGASLEEAISWRKVRAEEKTATVICDATIAFPIIVAAALER